MSLEVQWILFLSEILLINSDLENIPELVKDNTLHLIVLIRGYVF